MFKNKNLLALSLKFMIPVGLLISPDALFAQRYRMILPPAPPPPGPLNNTVQAQIANQNLNFNTGSSSSGGQSGIGGGSSFQQSTGGIQGTSQ